MLTKDNNIINISCSSYGSPGIGTYMDAHLEVITFWDAAKLILLLLGINNDNLYGVNYGKARIHCSLQDLYGTVISLLKILSLVQNANFFFFFFFSSSTTYGEYTSLIGYE